MDHRRSEISPPIFCIKMIDVLFHSSLKAFSEQQYLRLDVGYLSYLNLALSLSSAFFSILEIYDLDIPSSLAISRWASGLQTLPFLSGIPYRFAMISRSRSSSSSSIKQYSFSELILSSTSSSTLMSELHISASVSALPSASESIGSLMDISVSWCFIFRKCIFIWLAITHLRKHFNINRDLNV